MVIMGVSQNMTHLTEPECNIDGNIMIAVHGNLGSNGNVHSPSCQNLQHPHTDELRQPPLICMPAVFVSVEDCP